MNVVERAAQIWPVLGLAAKNRQVLSYQDVGDLIGVPARGLGQCLEPIQSYCLAHRLPPLTSIVVHLDDGMPGVGFIGAADVPAAQARVFRYDWSKHPCPTVAAIAATSSSAVGAANKRIERTP